jgi:hypothetical protein
VAGELIKALEEMAASLGGSLKEKKGVYILEAVLAERKAFLSKKKATYVARFRVDEQAREVRYSERLVASGSGLSGGDAGVSFSTETYKTGSGPMEGQIRERIAGLGPKFDLRFDYDQVRQRLEALAQGQGYRLVHALSL